MSDTPTPTSPPNPAPAAPKPTLPPELAKRKPRQLRPSQSKISKGSHRGNIADVKALIAKQDAPDHLKASITAELDASGAQAAVVDIHRHELKTPRGKQIIIHATISPLF